MDNAPACAARTYQVCAQFLTDGAPFASEHCVITVADGLDPFAIAQVRADDSPYANPHVPDLSIAIALAPEEPDDPSLPPVSGAVRPICPKCGSDDIVRDACARWSVEAQLWELEGIYDCQTCNACGAEGDEFARWTLAPSTARQDIFLWDVISVLQSPVLALDLPFQRFCLGALDRMTVEQCAMAWHADARMRAATA
ncbi:hypothetical protein [Flavisphingomonas formosensis]|uniref:hypothetical protein n=1 Tax=Flavisphingomonas formosensis TaxID=861534 RepID=UPI0012F74C77|nr:hypothetical protein [Sphingomonas formosensis]